MPPVSTRFPLLMIRRALVPGLLAVLGCTAVFASAAPEPNVIVRVDGQPITREQVMAANPQAAANAQVANQTVQTLINRLLLNKAAQEQKLGELPAVQSALAAAHDNVLAQAALEHYLQQHPVDEQQIKQQYDEMVKANPAHQYRVRLITTPSRDEAQHLLDEIKAGKRFSDLAAAHSSGPNAPLGGELGWVLRSQLQASVGSALSKLKAGEVTGPIAVPEGWAIVQLLQVRPTEVLPLSSVRAAIVQRIRAQQENAYLETLRKAAKIEVMAQPATHPPAAPASTASQTGAQS